MRDMKVLITFLHSTQNRRATKLRQAQTPAVLTAVTRIEIGNPLFLLKIS